MFESSGIKSRFTLKKLVSLGFLFPSTILIDTQLSMHNRKALRTNAGLWPSRERADKAVAERHYCPIKYPQGRTQSSHQHTPNTQLKRKTFKFSPSFPGRNQSEFNLFQSGSWLCRWSLTRAQIGDNSKGEPAKQSGVSFQHCWLLGWCGWLRVWDIQGEKATLPFLNAYLKFQCGFYF